MADNISQTATAPAAAPQSESGTTHDAGDAALEAALALELGEDTDGNQGDTPPEGGGSTEANRTGDEDPDAEPKPGSKTGEGEGEGEGGDAAGKAKEGEGDELDPNAQEEEPANGLEGLPKWAQKRLQRQSADIRKLREKLAPSETHPLAHVVSAEELRTEQAKAKADVELFGDLTAADLVENDKGEMVYELTFGKTRKVFPQAEVSRRLATARAVLNPDTVKARQEFIQTREQLRPWDQAEAIVPGIMKEGSPANAWLSSVVERAPALRAEIPDYELVLAHAWSDFTNRQKMAPTKEYPKGRFKQVWIELDKEGKPVSPKRADATPNKGAADKPKPQPAPQGGRAPQHGGQQKLDPGAALAALPATASREERLDAALKAELG